MDEKGYTGIIFTPDSAEAHKRSVQTYCGGMGGVLDKKALT